MSTSRKDVNRIAQIAAAGELILYAGTIAQVQAHLDNLRASVPADDEHTDNKVRVLFEVDNVNMKGQYVQISMKGQS